MRTLIAITASVLTVACTTSRPVRIIGPHGPVMSGELQLLPGGAGGGAECRFQTTVSSPIEDFERNYYCSVAKPSNVPEAERMMRSGFVLAELVCDRYMTLIANRNQDLAFAMETTALGGGVVATVLEITDASARSIALTAAGFAFTLAGMESFQEHYYFGPRVATVRRLISEGMDRFESEALADAANENTEFDHHVALSRVRQMQAICQVDSIQAYVDEAVERADIVFGEDHRNRLRGGNSGQSNNGDNGNGGNRPAAVIGQAVVTRDEETTD